MSISTLLDTHAFFVVGNPHLNNILHHLKKPRNLDS